MKKVVHPLKQRVDSFPERNLAMAFRSNFPQPVQATDANVMRAAGYSSNLSWCVSRSRPVRWVSSR